MFRVSEYTTWENTRTGSVNWQPRSESDAQNLDLLVEEVKQNLIGKKFFLVLDDLWNESVTEWNNLKSILNVGAHGSKILVTTGSRIVEYNVRGAFPPYNLQHLSSHECWSIIRKKAFSLGGASRMPSMYDIGKEISKKCAGLPLAATFFGNLMHLHNTEMDWLSIRDDVGLNTSDDPKEIIPILKLSYDILPSHLKQCFSYTSIFPKGWEIKKEKLVQLWMAEGFLQPSIGGSQKSMEDIGNDYFESLLQRSFFEVVKTDKLGEVLLFKIHDLLVDLARNVLGRDKLMIMNASEMNSSCFQKDIENASEVRHLHLILEDKTSKTFLEVLNAASKLRTVIASDSTNLRLDDLVSNTRLRVVCLSDVYHEKRCFADVIGMDVASSSLKFMHLRYLDLSGFRFEEVNEVSVGELYNLQTLVLSYCYQVKNILKGVGSLKNLRHLYLSSSDVERLPDSITSLGHLQTLNLNRCLHFKALPEDIGSLEHLKSLNLSSTSITELPDSLTKIRNLRRLDLVGISNLYSLPRDLGELTQLRCLDLTGTQVSVLPESCIQKLSNLEIVNLGSWCKVPEEITNWASLKSLIHSGIYNASLQRLTSLQELGPYDKYKESPKGIQSLTCLQELCPYIVREEDVVTGSKTESGIEKLANLNSLQVLFIENLKQVRGGTEEAERAELKEKPSIQKLRLDFGRLLEENEDRERSDDEMVLEGLEPHSNLEDLSIQSFDGLVFPKWMGSFNCLPNLVKLEISYCRKCVYLPNLGLLPCLRVLNIRGMSSLKCLGEEFYGKSIEVASSFFPSLVEMRILWSPMLEEWAFPPSSLHNSFPILEHLFIVGCSNLRTAPNSFLSLKELVLENTNSEAVNSILSSKGGGLTSLTFIGISSVDDFIYFPLRVLRNNTCLKYLKIKSCKNLKGFHDDLSLAEGTIANNSLYFFSITECPALSSLPDLRLWTSLRELSIYKCDSLKKNYDLQSLVFIEAMQFEGLSLSGGYKEIIRVTRNDSGIRQFAKTHAAQVLHIRNLENAIRGGKEVTECAMLAEHKRLRHLYLSWDSLNDDEEEENYRSVNDAEVLEGLKPNINLRKLTISGFKGPKLPKWMTMGTWSNYCLPNLVELYLLECSSCEQPTALGVLPYLRVLQIKGMNSVKCLRVKNFTASRKKIAAE